MLSDKWIKLFMILCTGLCLSFTMVTDNIKDDLVRLNKKMLTANSYRTSIRMVYDYAGKDQVVKAYSKKMNRYSEFQVMGTTFLNNKKVQLMVLDDDKQIFVQDPDPDFNKKDRQETNLQALDSLLNSRFDYKLISSQNGYKTVEMETDKDKVYASVSITYGAKDLVLKEIIYTCTKSYQKSTGLLRIKLVYDEFNFNPGLTQADFEENRYIKFEKKNKIVPVGKYQNYQIIDQRIDQ